MRKPGVKTFVVYDKKLLLILRDNNPNIPFPNAWNLPGGGIEKGESADEAIKRELEEEINIIPGDLIYLGKQIYKDGSKVWRYLSKLTKEEFRNVKLGNEGQRLGFFSPDEMIELEIAGYFKEYFNEYVALIKQLIEGDKILSPELLGLTK